MNLVCFECLARLPSTLFTLEPPQWPICGAFQQQLQISQLFNQCFGGGVFRGARLTAQPVQGPLSDDGSDPDLGK
jgi:hypothetical protein